MYDAVESKHVRIREADFDAGLQNPGFDFSGAEFSGQVPDPSTFMGGVRNS
jgi:hypothetical protein